MIRTETNRNCNALSMRDRSKKKIAVPKGVRRQLAATSTGPIRLGDSAAARKRRERERPLPKLLHIGTMSSTALSAPSEGETKNGGAESYFDYSSKKN